MINEKEFNINDVKDNKKYCELCGQPIDNHEIIKNYKPIDIIKKICDLSTRYPKYFQTLALTISNPGLTLREYGVLLGIGKNGVSWNLKTIEKILGCHIYCPKFKNNVVQNRRRNNKRYDP